MPKKKTIALSLRQLYTEPPRMQVGPRYSHDQRTAVMTAFNAATRKSIESFAKTQRLQRHVDFGVGGVQTHLPLISFACSDQFAAALQAARLPGVGAFMRSPSGFGIIPRPEAA